MLHCCFLVEEQVLVKIVCLCTKNASFKTKYLKFSPDIVKTPLSSDAFKKIKRRCFLGS